jgi:RNA recognition motif-containing protein
MVLFIGNVSKLTTEKELKELFASFGAIKKLRLMVDKITRRSRGYAYVDMLEDANALAAVQQLNTANFMNSCLIVGVATEGQLSKIEWF